MGIRGVDIQVAIQRASEADKLQQGQTGQARVGKASLKEKEELERVKAGGQVYKKSKETGKLQVRPSTGSVAGSRGRSGKPSMKSKRATASSRKVRTSRK